MSKTIENNIMFSLFMIDAIKIIHGAKINNYDIKCNKYNPED
jgi:hypothetical protein